MNKYFLVFKNSVQANLTYRFNFFVGIFSEGLGLVIFLYIWYSIYKAGDSVGSYSLGAITSYYVVVILMRLVLTGRNVAWTLGDEIRQGQVSKYLVKPVSCFGVNLAKSFGNIFSKLIVYLPLLLVVSYFIPSFEIGVLRFSLFVLSLCLAFFIDFLISYIVGISTFYFGFVMGLNYTMTNISLFFSGSLIPIDLLPNFWQRFASFLPFKFILYVPNQIISGRLTGSGIVRELFIGAAWLCLLFLFSSLVFKNGLKRFEGEGI